MKDITKIVIGSLIVAGILLCISIPILVAVSANPNLTPLPLEECMARIATIQLFALVFLLQAFVLAVVSWLSD